MMRVAGVVVVLLQGGCTDAGYGTLPDVSVQHGELPLILSAPHGGVLRPLEIPDRSYGQLGSDMNTAELAWAISAELEAATGLRPHLVINNLHRRKLDANREIVEAAQGNARAEAAWEEYHRAVAWAREAVAADHPSGLYVDLHGHSHDIQRVEVGYLLLGSELRLSASEQDTGTHCQVSSTDETAISCIEKSSIGVLVAQSGLSLSGLLSGAESLGTLLEADGIAAVPSLDTPYPLSDEPYWNGGYSTVLYGSRDGGAISGLQLEIPHDARQSADGRHVMAVGISNALLDYLDAFFGEPL